MNVSREPHILRLPAQGRTQRRARPEDYPIAYAEGYADAAESDTYRNSYAAGTAAGFGYHRGFIDRLREFYERRDQHVR